MKRGKHSGIFLLTLCMMLLMGCAGASEKAEEKDSDVVVQVSEGSTVEELFNFTSTQQISVSGAVEGFIRIGNLENGNSVVWSSDSVFLYVKGEANSISSQYYLNRLKAEPIPYAEFKE